MAYDTYLAERISNYFKMLKIPTEEKKMMGGLCYMVDEKMCVGIVKNQLMARIGPENQRLCEGRKGCSPMDFTGRPLAGYIFVDENALDKDDDLFFFIDLAIGFNPEAKSSRRKKKIQ